MYVNFDATATTATTTTKPFHDLEYRWNFGDAGSGNWTRGTGYNTSKNTAKGPVSAHVFETPGTYTINVTVTNGSSTVSNSCLQIAVQDPNVVFASNTICIAANSTPVAGSGGCPSGAAVAQNSVYQTALANAIAAGKKRILFKRGDTFTLSNANGKLEGTTGLLGAYGTGSAPILSGGTGTFNVFGLGGNGNSDPFAIDWRIMDFNVTAPSAYIAYALHHSRQITFLRINASSALAGFFFTGLSYYNGPSVNNTRCTGAFPYTGSCSDPMYDQIAIVDSSVTLSTATSGPNGIYFNGLRSAFMGNFIDNDLKGEHNIRTQHNEKLVVSHNTLQGAASTKHALTIRGTDPAGTEGNSLPIGVVSRQAVVSDNKIIGNTGVTQLIALKTQGGYNETFYDLLFERNQVVTNGSNGAIYASLRYGVTIRNNIFDHTVGGSSYAVAMDADDTWTANPSHDFWIYNNSVYHGGTGGFPFLTLNRGAYAATIKNNLIYAPNATGTRVLVSGGSGSDYTASNNSTAPFTANPSFASISPFSPVNVRPSVSSLAVSSGAIVPVFEDFFGATRSAPIDMGAVSH